MRGTVTKQHFWLVLKTFGPKKALGLLFSTEPVALAVLMA